MTKTEQIVAAIVAVLEVAGLTVRADTESLFSFEDLPVVVVDAGNEAPRAPGIGVVDWDLALSLFIGASGPAPKLAAEPTRAAAHAALYADRTLGGLVMDIVAGSVNRQIDEENPALGITEAIYHITYRQREEAQL
jgi:hypothetical protein